jgi:leucyl-tRNA---protein transferase
MTFRPSPSQKRIINKNQDLKFSLQAESYHPDYYQLYRLHSHRFKQQEKLLSEEEFHHIHFQELTDNSLVSRVTLNNSLVAYGLLEIGEHSLSSQYFVFDPAWSKRSLGTWGAIQEIFWAQQNRRQWYYLGFWINDNASMNYKKNFRPHQLFDWSQSRWQSP